MRLIRQLLTESVVLSLAGAAAGVAMAWAAVRAIANLGAAAFPRLAEAQLDPTTLAFTSAMAIATGLFFGVVPALQTSRTTASEALKEGSRGSSAGRASQRWRRALVTGEVALSLALVCGAGLLIKSFLRLQQVDPGFEPEGVLTMRVELSRARYPEQAAMLKFFRDLLDRVREMPGVESAGAISGLPLLREQFSGTTTMDTTAVPVERASPEADRRTVTPDYFKAMRTELVSGRFFEERDDENAQLVAMVDETLAQTYWPTENPIGRRLKFGGRQSTQPWRVVVGVVKHTRYRSLERASRVQVYVPFAQAPQPGMSLAIKTGLDPSTVALQVQRDIVRMDPEQPIFAVRPMTELMADSVKRRELVMALLASFGAIALALAAVGIYGVVSYWVAQRRNEIGIRLALGASRGDVLRMVMGQSAYVVGAGVAVGLAGSFGLTRLLESLLFNVNATDAPTFAGVSVTLIVVGLLASAAPALRAIRIDPARALREE
jgi:putative ABC transport system permease protein